MTVRVQFKDSTEAVIVAAFAGPQDPGDYPHQADIEETDARYLAFVGLHSGPAVDARRLRADLLSGSDWTVGNDSPLTTEKQAEWKSYRQALRDVTSQPGFPETIAWPTRPV